MEGWSDFKKKMNLMLTKSDGLITLKSADLCPQNRYEYGNFITNIPSHTAPLTTSLRLPKWEPVVILVLQIWASVENSLYPPNLYHTYC